MNLKDKLYPMEVIYTENADTMSEMATQFSRQGKRCLCFLRGASKSVFIRKLLCTAAEVAYESTQNGAVGEAEWARLVIAANRLAAGSVQTDSTAMTDEEILAQCKRLPSPDAVLILLEPTDGAGR